MKNKAIILLFSLLHVVFLGLAQRTTSRPNIILIMADDLGYKDLNFMGGHNYKTPNLDRLAHHSHVYKQGYAGAANCAPSRASLLTGLYTTRHGVYTVASSARGKAEDRKLIPIENTEVLSATFPTVANLLKQAGYKTASIGKWHLSDSPLEHGFDFAFGGNHSGHNKHFSPYKNKAIPDGPEGEYLTDRITNEAIDFIENDNQNGPFFMYLSYYAVHTPLEAPADLVSHYQEYTGSGGKDYKTYAAMIESLDINIGKLVQTLKDQSLLENTLIIFCSDNGGINTISPQAPLRSGKGSYYEGGIRIPFFIHWPNAVKPYVDPLSTVSLLDILPTIKEVVGTSSQALPFDGHSLLANLLYKKNTENTLFWHFPIYLEAYNRQQDNGRDPKFRTRPGSAIRYKQWKLHHYYEDDAYLLYDLSNDEGETTDLSKQRPAILKMMQKKLAHYLQLSAAPIPTTLNPKYIP